MKVVQRVQKKIGRKVELLSPMLPPVEKKEEEKKEEPKPPKPEEKEPTVITVVLKVHMHCEACVRVIRKKILKMKGVQSAEPDLKVSQVTVKGAFEESKITDYVHKRIDRNAAIVKSETVPPLRVLAMQMQRMTGRQPKVARRRMRARRKRRKVMMLGVIRKKRRKRRMIAMLPWLKRRTKRMIPQPSLLLICIYITQDSATLVDMVFLATHTHIRHSASVTRIRTLAL